LAKRPQEKIARSFERQVMDNLAFGVFDTIAPDQRTNLAAAYDAHIDQACLAESLGYEYYFFIEHQNALFPVISSPNVYLAAVARATSTLRFGAMVFQLPMHHPVRLAQDAAMVDQLSRGRLEFAIGYGTQSREFSPWCIDFTLRRELGLEVMEVVQKAWANDMFSHHGAHFTFEGAQPQPRPFQQPSPPIWMGGHSPTSIAYAAESGFGFAQNMDVEHIIAEKFASYLDAWKRYDHKTSPRTLLVRHVHVAETDDVARKEAEPFMLEGLAGQKGVARALSLKEAEKTPEMLEIARIYIETAKSYDFWIDEGLAFVGSPETVTRAIERQRQLCGYDVLLTHHQITGMPSHLAMNSLRLFGERVIPEFGRVSAMGSAHHPVG
jgi:alkanesulfonate monooxygenase SsuD/methylene tetrahydromethanopterin reductase-like flavin-dependent oxidoreductase (luciferase family)